jgi:rhodanese-related sulfurtransferase
MQKGDITVQELKQRLDAGEKIILVDVREAYEYEDFILGGLQIPMSEFADKLALLEAYKDNEIVLYCRVGPRSASMVAFLKSNGFANPRNLKGGLEAWQKEFGK